MDIIKLSDINFAAFEKMHYQGDNSTIYTNGDICIKRLEDLTREEKGNMKHKLIEMEGISIADALLPKGLILDGDILDSIIIDNFKNSKNFFEKFGRTRYIDCAEMFSAVKKASLILREIHENGIVCQDLSFSNILIDKEGNIKYCDMDSCYYNGIYSPYSSVLLERFMFSFRKEKQYNITKNTDRLSLFLSFIQLLYAREIQKLSSTKYQELSSRLKTLENCKKYFEILINKRNPIPQIPYMDELIDDSDKGSIDRTKQLSLFEKLMRI